MNLDVTTAVCMIEWLFNYTSISQTIAGLAGRNYGYRTSCTWRLSLLSDAHVHAVCSSTLKVSDMLAQGLVT